MRYQGRITEWNDAKGFGYIEWNSSSDKLFLHISAFSERGRRPALGDIVTYEAERDPQAPLRTVNGFVQLLERKLPQAEGEVREYLSFILEASSQMRELIRALLELSRVGQNGVHTTDFQLRGAVPEPLETA